jgi:flagellar motor switch protein FliN/FliY
MATTFSPPVTASGQPPILEPAKSVEIAAEQALVPLSREVEEGEPIRLTPALARLPVELDVAVPVRNFRVRNLLALETGKLVETDWNHGDDLPLAAGPVQLAWSEFEVVESRLAVRVTRLA